MTTECHQVERMAYTGETPWHGLGSVFTDTANVDQCMAEAGLNYEAQIGPCFDQRGEVIPFTRSINRSTDGRCVGTVGNGFVPLQCEQIAAFLRPWVAAGRAKMETAGSLRDGRVVWALARVETVEIGKGDAVNGFILCAHAHDGSMAINAGLTPVRVVCRNTMSAAVGIGAKKGLIKVAHRANASVAMEQVTQAMEAADLQWRKLTEIWKSLKARPVRGEAAVRAFAGAVFGVETDDAGDLKKSKTVDRVVELYENGIGNAGGGTLWELLNAATEKITHDSPTATGARNVAGRVDALSFGEGRRQLDRALDVARVMDRQIPIDAVFPKGSEVLEKVMEEVWRAA